ncbi:MAG TPA: site-2 protease family protein [Acidimicrobiales bacterium]|nr:site-2 protease family protein [Acidimicrobiales bacterium]
MRRVVGPGGRVRGYQVLAGLLVVVLAYILARGHIVRGASLLLFAVLIPSIILHEISHGVVALALGDDTAKRAGRLTLNPIPHIDILGSLILPAVLVIGGFPAFGYAKPVPVNVSRLRHPRNGSLVVALAGPATNIVLAGLAALGLRLVLPTIPTPIYSPGQLPLGVQALFYFGVANVLLAVFNLIPLPPLDGSAVIERFLPRSWLPGYLRIRMFALPVVFLLVFLVPGVLNHVFDPAINLWAHLLGP